MKPMIQPRTITPPAPHIFTDRQKSEFHDLMTQLIQKISMRQFTAVILFGQGSQAQLKSKNGQTSVEVMWFPTEQFQDFQRKEMIVMVEQSFCFEQSVETNWNQAAEGQETFIRTIVVKGKYAQKLVKWAIARLGLIFDQDGRFVAYGDNDAGVEDNRPFASDSSTDSSTDFELGPILYILNRFLDPVEHEQVEENREIDFNELQLEAQNRNFNFDENEPIEPNRAEENIEYYEHN